MSPKNKNKIKNTMQKIHNESYRIKNALLFAFVFTFVGWVLPNIYFRYLDNTVYYQIKSPAPVNKQIYKPCETVQITIQRKSLIDTDAEATLELTRLVNSQNIEIEHTKRPLSIDRGESTIIALYPLPCIINDGEYYISGSVAFRVRDIPKIQNYRTVTFNVVN